MELRVTDAPPPGVTKVLVTAKNFQVHRAGVPEGSGWETVIPGEKSFDLVAITGLEQILGSNQLPAGDYTQVRMEVVSVTVTLVGVGDRSARVPSGELKVVRPFTVEAGQITVLLLDFDADKSVVITGRDDVQFKPVVKLEVTRGPKPTPTAKPKPTPGATATPAPKPTPAATPTPTGALPTPTATPGPTPGATATPTPGATATPTPKPTPAATPTPTGALPTPTAKPAPSPTPTSGASPEVREIRVTLTLPAFTPSTISVRAGENVRLVLTSTDFPHTFSVAALGIDISVPGNSTVTREVTVPNQPGNHLLICRPHESSGMTGTFTVTP